MHVYIYTHTHTHTMQEPQGVDSSLDTLMMCMSHYEIKPLIHGNFTEEHKCIHSYTMLENGFMYLY